MKEIVNLRLIMEPTFLLFGTSSFLGYLGYFIPIFYIPDMAVSRGVERGAANFLLSICGKLIQKYHKLKSY